MFKSSIAALVKPFVTLFSLASSCFDSTFCLETQGLAPVATLCSGNGGGVKDFECIQEACGVPKEQAPFCFLFQTNFKEKGAPFLNTFNKDIIPQIPGDVSVKDTLRCVPAVISNFHALSARSANTDVQQIEWIADSGAGRDLCSERAFLEQGFSKNMLDQFSTAANPTKLKLEMEHLLANRAFHLRDLHLARLHIM